MTGRNSGRIAPVHFIDPRLSEVHRVSAARVAREGVVKPKSFSPDKAREVIVGSAASQD